MDTPPNYGIVKNQPLNKNNLLTTHYRLGIRRLPNTMYFCQSANIPGLALITVEQPTSFNPIIRSGGRVLQEDLKISFVVDEDFKNWREVRNWMLNCSDYIDYTEYKVPSEHLSDEITLFVLDSNHHEVSKIVFYNAFPNFLSGIEYNSTNPSTDPVVCQATFAYTYYKIFDI